MIPLLGTNRPPGMSTSVLMKVRAVGMAKGALITNLDRATVQILYFLINKQLKGPEN